jgi:hypothetical protein
MYRTNVVFLLFTLIMVPIAGCGDDDSNVNDNNTLPTGDMYRGGLAWNNWTNDLGGGSGLPAGVDSDHKDFVRCKACHGWDGMGLDGGYVRRSANDTRPNPIAGGNFSSHFGSVTADDIWHTSGRDWATLDTSMPD